MLAAYPAVMMPLPSRVARSHARAALATLAAATMLCAALAAGMAPPASPAPTASTPTKPLRVYLLAGQSNMEGHGVVDLNDARDYNGGRGTLAQFVDNPANKAAWGDLRAADGSWFVRDDVFVSYLTEQGSQKAGALSVGFAVYDDKHHIGPELGIGRALGNAFAEPVLLIKTAWGGKSLAKDFRPPSAGGAVGPYYKQMIAEYRAAVAAIPTQFPALAGYTPRLDGVIWFQGWNDGCDEKAAAEYEGNLVHLITDMRAEFGNPKLSFVVGETGNMDNAVLRHAQRDGCLHKEVATGTSFVPTRQFLRDAKQCPNPGHGHHWFGSGESYLLIGDALGKAAVQLAPDPRPAPALVPAPAPVTSSARPAQP